MVRALIWSVTLYGAETWTMKKEDVKAFEMWIRQFLVSNCRGRVKKNFNFFLLFITVNKKSYGILDKNILCRIKNIFFSLFHQRADDEALTRFLQTSVFLVASPILVKSMFFPFRSSLTLSIQVFLCLPLLLFPSTCPC